MTTTQVNNTDEINTVLQSKVEDLLIALGFDLDSYFVTDSEIRGVGLCHSGADNPSGFTYYMDSGIWKCWTNHCHEKHGCDLIGLIRVIKNLSFIDAIKFIEDFLGGKIDAEINQIKRANKIFQKYKNYWNDHLEQPIYEESILSRLSSATKYAKQRNLSPEIFEQLSIGFARTGKLKNRIVIPVRKWSGEIIGFTGRKLYDEQSGPKWKHYGFNKIINFWNIERAYVSIMKSHTAILCEGPFDVIKMNMAGIENAMAILGTEVHDGQIELLLKCHTMRVVLALDNDDAGIKASDKHKRKLERKLFDVSVVMPPDDGVDFGEMETAEVKKIMENIL